MKDTLSNELEVPAVVDRITFQVELDALRVREKAHTREGAYERRRIREKAMDNRYRLLDLTVYGRQETWEDSPTGWPPRWEGKQRVRTDGRSTAQWSRLKARYSDDLSTGGG